MNSRDAILSRIRTALAQDAPIAKPPVPPVWPQTDPSAEEMAQRFAQELEAISGEVIRCPSLAAARDELATMADRGAWDKIGAVDRALSRDLLAAMPAERVLWAKADWTPQGMADLPVGVIEADYLLADTGSALVACPTAHERLMCYLPPVCVVVATAERLVEHMPAVWPEVARRAADPSLRGEFVIITGPSRTADIEKILILGVHGPKRLIVLLING